MPCRPAVAVRAAQLPRCDVSFRSQTSHAPLLIAAPCVCLLDSEIIWPNGKLFQQQPAPTAEDVAKYKEASQVVSWCSFVQRSPVALSCPRVPSPAFSSGLPSCDASSSLSRSRVLRTGSLPAVYRVDRTRGSCCSRACRGRCRHCWGPPPAKAPAKSAPAFTVDALVLNLALSSLCLAVCCVASRAARSLRRLVVLQDLPVLPNRTAAAGSLLFRLATGWLRGGESRQLTPFCACAHAVF